MACFNRPVDANWYFEFPPALVLIGAIAMTASVIWLGISFFKIKM